MQQFSVSVFYLPDSSQYVRSKRVVKTKKKNYRFLCVVFVWTQLVVHIHIYQLFSFIIICDINRMPILLDVVIYFYTIL